jgi:cytochrome c oxidase assembly protein subunit 15
VVLACATFPLVWVGGLVTTTDAGMAVPDWPNTYGYNLFLYPWQTWLAGPWDLFVEHGHRLLGALVGMLTIGLVVVLWRSEERRWLRRLGIVALVLVVFQGVLGGLRVLLDERTLAMLHGCTGPLFFALAVAIAVFTTEHWRATNAALLHTGNSGTSSSPLASSRASHVRRLAVVTCLLVYLQLVLGAVLRHVPVVSEPATFALAVRFHLLMAAVLTLHVLLLAWSATRHCRQIRWLHRLVLALGGLLVIQLALGAATWIVKFSVPTWAARWWPWPAFTVHADGWLQTHIITAHVAVGSLLLAAATATALVALRTLPRGVSIQHAAPGRAGLAT